MNISVALLPSSGDGPAPDVAVVIDVLRATSVMATAIANGADQIITYQSVDEARKQRTALGESVLLCGERHCQKIEGFDLGNSPAEYSSAVVQGRTLVLTTTNGTRAIQSVQHAKRIVTASFLNQTAVIDSLDGARSIALVCAGTDLEVTGEDVLLAGAIVAACQERFAANLIDDGASTARQAWQTFLQGSADLSEALRETTGGRNLVRYGFQDDILRCSSIDSLSVVPTQIRKTPTVFASDVAS